MIESNIIYSFEDFRVLILEKAKEGAYYLLYDDIYFEEIDKNTIITREVFTLVKTYTKSFNIIKYVNFKFKDNCTTKELFEIIESLRKYNKILVTIYNQKKKECFLMYISNKADSKLEKEIKNLLETEK